MIYSLTWLPAVLRQVGLKVAEVEGWEGRGRGDVGTLRGIICHHTAGPKDGNMPSLKVLINGRSDLPGPLAQLGLGRDGTYYVIAAGKCNHAGTGSWQNLRAGNTQFLGIEAENTGLDNDMWPEVQMDAYRRGVAAILTHMGCSSEFCAGHKEYALPAGRKSDPSFDMDAFRLGVAAIMSGAAPLSPLIPAIEPAPSSGATPARVTLRRGVTGDLVRQMQEKIGAHGDGIFGATTEAKVRQFQRLKGLVPDGIVGPKTWKALDTV